jgi:hypothetical protein
MSDSASTPEERFAALVEAFRADLDVTPPSDGMRFGSSGLKVHNTIFAMLVRDRLVVKLPRSRVDALVASGDGERYDPRGDGRLMKEWVVIAPTARVDWVQLAREAMGFVASQH